MDFTGRIIGTSQDLSTGFFHITFEVDKDTAHNVIDCRYGLDTKLQIHIGKYRKKRSLDANSYMWALLTRMATALKTTKEELYEKYLRENRLYYKDEDGYVVVTVPARTDMTKIAGHWQYSYSSEDGKFKAYTMLKGSSDMDTKEMSELLESIVQGAKELGIPTETDYDHQVMLEEWGRRYEKTHKHNN